MSEAVFAGIGTAHLSSELDSDGPYTISGIALGAGDVTVGSSGVKKLWPAEELQQAAETLEGQPLVRDHKNSTDGRVGTVTEAYYSEGVGVMYEAEIAPHYEQLAKDIAAGIQEVSARAYHDPVDELEEDEETGAKRTTNIVFDNLSVVSQGAAPSNTAEIGGLDVGDAIAMAQGPAGDAVATLEQGSPRPDTAELAQFSEGDWVKGDSSGGTWHGKVRGMKEDGCYSDKIDGDQEICADDDSPVYLIENYDPEDGEFTDTMVAHKESGMASWDHEENASKASIDAETAELEASMEELDEVYSEWSDHVNMSASTLEEWSEHPCHSEASMDPEAVIDRNMNLLETDKSDWGTDEIEDAKRTISFVSRMSDEANEPDEPRDGPNGCPSEWAISLLNWAHNPFDSLPDVPDEMEEESASGTADGDTAELEVNHETVNGAVWMEVPESGDTVTTPVNFIVGSHGFTIEGAHNSVAQGRGHPIVIVNDEFVEAGEMVPHDDSHYHIDQGDTEFELDLPAGEHMVRLQMADADHRAYDLRDSANITVIDPDDGDESEENMPAHRARRDDSAMPRGDMDGTPEWEEGDMVRWQVEPDLFGKIVHVDDEKHVAMVEIMGMESGDMTSTGFTVTAGFSDLKPMQVPESKSDMSGHKMDEEMSVPSTIEKQVVAEMAEIAGMDVNGLVMWDDKMGSIEDFTVEDGEVMMELALIEREGGSFQKTGETVSKSMSEVEMADHSGTGDVAELEAAWHTPDWDGLDEEREWEKPAMEDFDTDNMSEIDDHFLVSKTGEWPPEDYGDLALPVVFPDGDLSLDGLDSAHQMAGQVDGISDDMADKLQSKLNDWAEEHFDQPVAGEQMQAATLDDDAFDGQSTLSVAALSANANNTVTYQHETMTDVYYDNATEEEIDEMSDPVVMEESEIEELRAKASEADEISERLDELAANQELLDDVDEDKLSELQEYDEAVVLTEDEHEELQGLVDDIGGIFAEELAEHSAFDAEELQERFTPLELRDKVADHEQASVSSELGESETDPEPDGETVDPEELEESGADAQDAASEEELREAVAEHLENGKMYRQAEKVREGEIGLDEMGIDVESMLD